MTVPAFVQRLINDPIIGDPAFWRISNPAARAANEGGIDIPAPGGTPVYALAAGTLESNHLFWHNPPDVANPHGGAPGYGVLTERVNIPGFGLNDLYYQHIDLNPAIPTCMGGDCNNIQIAKGELIGWTRGDVGELEMGVNANWGPVWGPDTHPGPWVDPETRIRSLVAADPSFNWGTETQGGGPTSTSNCSCNPLDFVRCQIALLTGNIDPKDQTCACCYGKVVTNPQFQNFANSPGISYVAGVSDFMGQLQSPGMWIRIGAVMFGLLIIAIAIWKMI